MERREETLKWIWLAEAIGAASRLGVALLRVFGTVEQIYQQKPEEAEGWTFLTKKERGQMMNVLSRKSLDGADRILRQCEEKYIRVVGYNDMLYPASLRALPTAPMVLYYKGNMPVLDRRFTVAVVGTRSMSDYGRQMAYRLGHGLTAGGALIVSGMALGVDSVAMMGALDAGGTVVGVLGSGVDVIYPRQHTQVYHRILDRGGCILSEYPPGTEPKGFHFPVRNRIISGLSDAGVVVEGDAKSGALITARNLIYQGRKLFAVPGQIGLPGSEGPNALIRNGALPALEPEDILSEFVYLFPDSIHMGAARLAERQVDADTASRHTMQEIGVGIKAANNFVGEGTYGGRRQTTGAKTKQKPTKQIPPEAPTTTEDTKENPRQSFTAWMREAAAQVIAEYAGGKSNPAEAEPEIPGETGTEKKTAPKPAKGKEKDKVPTPAPEENRIPVDTSLLEEADMRIYNLMKPNVPVTADELVSASFSVGQILSAMTALEMAGIVEAGGGGYFLRTDPDDFPVSLVEDGEIADKQT